MTTMYPHALFRVQTKDGRGVREGSPFPGARLPMVCILEEAARLHRNEARKLRKWAIAHGIPAQCVRLTPDPPKQHLTQLLRIFAG